MIDRPNMHQIWFLESTELLKGLLAAKAPQRQRIDMDHLLKKALNGYMWALYGAFDCQYQVERFLFCFAGWQQATVVQQATLYKIDAIHDWRDFFWVLLDHSQPMFPLKRGIVTSHQTVFLDQDPVERSFLIFRNCQAATWQVRNMAFLGFRIT